MKIKELIKKFEKIKVLVIGDIFLDKYIIGEVNRISAEAPVPIVLHNNTQMRLGGAGNVALNIKNLKAQVSLVGIIGDDNNSDHIIYLLNENKINHDNISYDAKFTIVKERIIGNGHQIVRIDYEKNTLKNINKNKLIENIKKISKNYDICIISDYNKGTITKEVINAINESCFIISDTKGDLNNFKNTNTITPNIFELIKIAEKQNIDTSLNIEQISRKIIKIFNINSILVTKGKDGLQLITLADNYIQPSIKTNVFDVSGAGDTVIASYSLAKYVKASYQEALKFASITASIVISEFGTTPINYETLINIYGNKIL